ncbi:MAG: hypothetical protein S4CHLAM7_01050 [Chlamydiae bacterium]|nr:hypothetical protein [Chlamydiota bacterium]
MESSNNKSLIVVSNRLPVSIETLDNQWKIGPSSGGLASALTGVKQDIPFTWIGWPGAAYFPHQQIEIKEALEKENLIPVFLNKEQEEHYYHTICNSVLWPFFHYFTEKVLHVSESWNFYTEVNELFAQEIIKQAPIGATIWIQDFHLMLLPKMLKEQRPDLYVGFFLHIPFPSSEIYRMLPKRKTLLEGILGSDYIGFHTSDYARHFRNSCLRILGLTHGKEALYFKGRKIGVGVNPIGINIRSFDEILSKPKYFSYIQEMKEQYKNHQVVLGVERLDYTKGIFFKLQAFEIFLEQNPDLIGKVILLQIIVPCRLDSPEYQKHRNEIEKIVSRINGRFSRPGFNPVHYMYRSLPLSELIALYCLADVCMVTSTRDGMNLVAQEFVYCAQRAQTKGVLILSEFAGSAHQLSHTLLVNPFDIEGMAKTIKKALEIPDNEKESNLNKMEDSIKALNSSLWAKQFLQQLTSSAEYNQAQKHTKQLSSQNIENLIQKATHSHKKTFILDYDGTLRELTSHPMDAVPSQEILDLIQKLSELKNTEVHIVSGRDGETLHSWFGHLPISLSAEHGYLHKNANEKNWTIPKSVDITWMPYVREILKKTVDEVPGSLLETKSCVLNWHYKLAPLGYGEWRANELYSTLVQELANLPVEILTGKHVIEVRSQGVSKANYLNQILNKNENEHFILCIGDDLTDHDMYKTLPKDAFSIHVGETSAQTTFQLSTPSDVRSLLEKIYTAVSEKDASPILDQ